MACCANFARELEVAAPPPLARGWWPSQGWNDVPDIGKGTVSRYRYRGDIPTPWPINAA